ncbi:MAG: ABC transporter ATP-binding protein [Desulfovibrionales bacterium]
MIALQDIRKSFQLGPMIVEVLKGVTLKVEEGELLSIIGSSGCGKSTLMNILGFLDLPTSGQYLFEDKPVKEFSDSELSSIRNKKIGFVFQQFHLLPRLTALENTCLPLVYRGVSEKRRKETARDMLARVGMADREDHRPSELSGGQQQRIAIARALSGSPSVILADEPTGALDTDTSGEIMNLFMELNTSERITTIIITHDPMIADQCHRVVRMHDGVLREGSC